MVAVLRRCRCARGCSGCCLVRLWGRAAWCARGRRPAREIATREPAARSGRSRSPARPRRRRRAPQPGPAAAHGPAVRPSGPSGALHTSGALLADGARCVVSKAGLASPPPMGPQSGRADQAAGCLKPVSPLRASAELQLKPSSPLRAPAEPRLKPPSPLLACACVGVKPRSPLRGLAEPRLKPSSPLRAPAERRLKPSSPLRVGNGHFWCVFRVQR